MIANINVRFFTEAWQCDEEGELSGTDHFEITEACFIALHNQPGVVDYDRNTVFANGILMRQVYLTVICDDLPYADELEVVT